MWWNGDLKEMRKELNRLRTMLYHNCAIANHHSHRELQTKSRQYGRAIILAKRTHWAKYLEGMTADDIWTANKYIKNPVGDGGMPKIPTIKTKDKEGNEIEINNSKEKAKAFIKAFFPNPPPPQAEDELPADYPIPLYPIPLPNPPPPDKQQLEKVICKLSPYKTPGPDGIPNIVLQKCFNLMFILHSCVKISIFFLSPVKGVGLLIALSQTVFFPHSGGPKSIESFLGDGPDSEREISILIHC